MPGKPSIDPCRQWLGISAVDIGDPRKLLGLPPTEGDPIRIVHAAESRLERLRNVEPGPYEVARRALMSRVAEARDALLASARSMPTPPPIAVPPAPIAIPPEAINITPPVIVQAAPSEPARVYRRRSTNWFMLLLVVALMAAVAALAYLFGQNRSPWQAWQGLIGQFMPPPAVAPPPPAAEASPSAPAPRPAAPGGAPASDAKASAAPAAAPRATVTPPQPPAPPPATPPSPPSATPQPQPQPPPVAVPKPVGADPMPDSKTIPAAPPADDAPDRLAMIDAAIVACREGMANRDFEAAERAITAVSDIAPDRQESGRIAAWLLLVGYAKGFREYRDQAIASIKVGNEFDMGGKKLVIVEVNDRALMVKRSGRIETWKRTNLPPDFETAVMNAWFDDTPANKLYIGAYYFTRSNPDHERAEKFWRIAMDNGADASPLLSLLTDPVVVESETISGETAAP